MGALFPKAPKLKHHELIILHYSFWLRRIPLLRSHACTPTINQFYIGYCFLNRIKEPNTQLLLVVLFHLFRNLSVNHPYSNVAVEADYSTCTNVSSFYELVVINTDSCIVSAISYSKMITHELAFFLTPRSAVSTHQFAVS